MDDLDVVVKAIKDVVIWIRGSADHAQNEIAYRLHEVAERIEELRKEQRRVAGIEGTSTRAGCINEAVKSLNRFPKSEDLPVILGAVYDAGDRHGYQRMQDSL